MPQLFQVLKCFKCSVFQVHQTKKANKWECKVCGEKQSIKRHYGLGTAKECRLHVQKLNGIRSEIEELNETAQLYKSSDEEPEIPLTNKKPVLNTSKKSKWSNYVEKTEDAIPKKEPENNMLLGNAEVVLEMPVKKRKKFKPPKLATDFLNVASEVRTISLDYEPVETVVTQTFTSDSKFDNNSFFKIKKQKSQITLAKPIVPSFGRANENIEICDKPKITALCNYNHNLQNNEKLKSLESDKTNTYVPPKVNKNSKWAEYSDEAEENLNQDPESINTEKCSQAPIKISQDTFTSPQKVLSQAKLTQNLTYSQEKISQNVSTKYLFMLCNDSELDEVLDF